MSLTRTVRQFGLNLSLVSTATCCLVTPASAQQPNDATEAPPEAERPVEAPAPEAPAPEAPAPEAPAPEAPAPEAPAPEAPTRDASAPNTPDAVPDAGEQPSGSARPAPSPEAPADNGAPPEPGTPAPEPDPPTPEPEPPQEDPTAAPSPAPAAPLPEPTQPDAPPVTTPEPVEVVVLGSRASRAPGSVHVIGKRQLERFRRDDPNAIVLQAPGVYVRQEDGVGLRPNIGIRGANSDRSKKITLMEDGVLFGPAPYSAPAAYYFPLMARMLSVRVIKGPAAIAYGPNTVGGAVDFTTRPIPSALGGLLDVGVGQYGYLKTHATFGASTDNVGFLIEGVRLHDEGFKQLPSGADTGSTRNDWMVKARYELDPLATNRHSFELKLGYADEVSNETYLGLSDEDFERDPDQRYAASALDQMKNHRTSLVATHRLDLDGRATVTTQVYRNDYARTWRKANALRGASLSSVLADPDDPSNAAYLAVLRGEVDAATAGETLLIGPNDRTFVSQGVQSVLSTKPTTGMFAHAVELGVRLHNDSIERRHSQTGFVMTDGALVPEGSAEEVTAANTAETTALAVHALDAISWRDLTLTPGVRFELIRSEFDDALNEEVDSRWVRAWMPGLGGYYAITDQLGVLAGVYRGFSPPAPGSDEQARPEFSVNTEAGLRYSDHPLRLEAVGFYNDYQNLTDVCTFSSGCLDDNLDRQLDAGQALIWGVEAYAAHDIPLGPVRLPLSLSYTWTRARFENSFTSNDPIYGTVEAGFEIPYVPRHQLVGSVGVENDDAGVSLGANYVGKSREAPGRGALSEALTTDEQFWLDASANVKLWKALTFYANVRNLLDARHLVARRPYGARPNAPRWVQLGARVDY